MIDEDLIKILDLLCEKWEYENFFDSTEEFLWRGYAAIISEAEGKPRKKHETKQ